MSNYVQMNVDLDSEVVYMEGVPCCADVDAYRSDCGTYIEGDATITSIKLNQLELSREDAIKVFGEDAIKSAEKWIFTVAADDI